MKLFERVFKVDSKQEDKINKELDESYSNMVNTIAWKDMEIFLNELITQSITDQDAVSISDYTLAEASEGRGIRKAVDKIRKHIGFHVRVDGE